MITRIKNYHETQKEKLNEKIRWMIKLKLLLNKIKTEKKN